MISVNILFPNEKKRIIKEITKKIKSDYNEDIKSFKFQHIGSEKVYLYIFLENGASLYITAEINNVFDSITICNDMSL